MKELKLTALQKALANSRKTVLTPPSKLNVVEWADRHRYLSPEASSTPGRWRTSSVEPARGPMLEVTNPKVKTITVMGCTQLLKTELINNIVGYHIHQDPSPIIVMQPTIKVAETWAKDRLDKMLRDTPILKDLVSVKRSRGDSDNTILHRGFPGGHITAIGANSPADLAMRPVRIVLCDEIDKYPASAGKEGDPIKLIEERTDTFYNALHVRVCSPTIEGQSRVAEEYALGDQRTYHGKCPYCNHYEDLVFSQVRYDEDNIEESTAYECSKCNALWSEGDRAKAIGNGKYIAHAPFNGHASFKVNKIASLWKPLSDLVKKFIAAKGNADKLKTFFNTQLAETWKIKSDSPDHMRLYERREHYAINSIPTNDVAFLTFGCDVQGNRLEVEITGWCQDKQSYLIDYRTIVGLTSTDEPWLELDKILDEKWKTPDGRMLQISMGCVDSGFNTQHVYNWVRKKDPNRIRAIKGQDHLQMIFGKPSEVELNWNGQKIKNATRVWPLGVNILKSELYSWLKLDGALDGEENKMGFCHFPQLDENYFQGLCSEQLVERIVRKRSQYAWEKKFERNEPLDCRNYSRAAASMFGIDRFSLEDWQILKGLGRDGDWTVSNNIEGEEESEEDNDSLWGNRDKKKFW